MTNNVTWFWVLAGALLITAAAQPASAERHGRRGGKGRITSACKADLGSLCKNVEPGKGRLRKCLKAHESELSANCRAAFKAKKAKFRKNHPCKTDKDKFCKGRKGKDRAACMKEHKGKLSEACRAKRAERKEKRREKHRGDKGRRGKSADKP